VRCSEEKSIAIWRSRRYGAHRRSRVPPLARSSRRPQSQPRRGPGQTCRNGPSAETQPNSACPPSPSCRPHQHQSTRPQKPPVIWTISPQFLSSEKIPWTQGIWPGWPLLGQISPVRVPGPADEAARDLVRNREDVRADLMRARHRVSNLVLRHGLIYSGGQAWTDSNQTRLHRQHHRRIPGPGPHRTFLRRFPVPRRDHQDRQHPRPPTTGRGCLTPPPALQQRQP
jgi:hypothetical protein